MTKSNTYYYDEAKAERPIRFIETQIVIGSDGDKRKYFRLEEWQKDIIRQAFGWYHKKTHLRKHRFVYIELPKGNGKSYLLSAIALYLAFADGVDRTEVYCVAGDRRQAEIVFNTSKEMVEDSPDLSRFLESYKRTIVLPAKKQKIEVLSADANTKHGFRPYGICFDETHVQPNGELYNTLTKGLMKIRNSMCFLITTAGVKNTWAETVHDKALKVKNGLLDLPTWLPIIFHAEQEDDPFDPKTWYKANPGLGSIIDFDNFKDLAREAETTPSDLNSFKRLHLNIWTGSTESWIPPHEWEKCNLGEVDESELEGLPCWAGLDLASTRDLSSFAIIWELEKDKSYLLRVWFWCPADTVIERTLNENVNYQDWVDKGLIFTTPGNVTDQRYIKAFIEEMYEKYGFSIGYDKFIASQLMAELYTEQEIQVRAIPQRISHLSEPCKWMEKAIYQQKINHEGNPVLAWQADNVEIYRDNNDNIRPDKAKSKDKIDGVAASVTAIAQMLECKREEVEEDPYADGVTFV